MVQKIKQANIFGRVGSGLAQGAGLQLPKEIEHYRMSKGLRELEGQDLDPQQYFTRALSVSPGMADRPQVVQSLADLARQQMRGQALIQQQNQQQQPTPNPFPEPKPKSSPGTEIPSITKPGPLGAIQKGYIPPTQDEIYEDAGRRYSENPKLFGNDPNKALQASEDAAIRQQKIFEAQQTQHQNLTKLQDNVVQRLGDHSKKLDVNIPANLYSRIEDKAVNAVKPVDDGGEGLTEQQAMKKYGDELDSASRDYSKIKEVGGWAITARPAEASLRTLKGLQEKFAKRGDTENFANILQAENQISPKLAYAIAEPISKVPEANSILKNLKPLSKPFDIFALASAPDAAEKTMKIAPKLAELVKKHENLSPLAIAYELERKGYDPDAWLDYVTNNRKDLNLKESQGRQIDTPINSIDPWNDWWLSSWTGIQ